MAYTNGSSIKKVLIDGVLHPVNDYRIEGTNFAVTQIAGDIAVGTPLTTEQLEHITGPVMSADGCVINAPALGTILIPKNVVFNPAATDDYVISYVSSPLEGKTYNLKITMDHTTGLPKEAVFAEEEVAAPPTNILKTKLDTYKTEFAKPVAERSATIVAEAKVFGNDVLSKKPNIIVELDADNQPVEVFHATESPDPTAYYRYVNGKNECIDIYYDNSTDPYTTTDLAFPDLENIYVEKAKEYMEIATTVNSVVYRTNKPVMIDEDTLGFTQVEQATQTQGTAGIIHYPKSVLFTGDAPFKFTYAPVNCSYVPDAKIEVSQDGLTWTQPVWDEDAGFTYTVDTLNNELGKYSIFIRSDNHINDLENDLGSCFSITPSNTNHTNADLNIKMCGVLNALWGGKPVNPEECHGLFTEWDHGGRVTNVTNDWLADVSDLIFPNDVTEKCYTSMFANCVALKKGPIYLPATTMAESCYEKMFQGCELLTQAPALPATALAFSCYQQMFQGCISLTQAPATLPATTMAVSCCAQMFNYCTSLTQAPVLPATIMAESCYAEMFSGCESLVQTPALPATTLANNCYNSMFSECTALTQAPSVLPATTLVDYCYYGMFSGCTSLTQAPALPAANMVEGCYTEMFYSCTKLTQAPALPATILATECYTSMFDGCTKLTQAPALPATTLEYCCYKQMFQNCTSLTQAPALPATTLGERCYYSMFQGCTALTKPVTFPEITTLATDCMVEMFKDCLGIKWATSGTPYIIKTTDGSTTPEYTLGMFEGNGGIPFPTEAGRVGTPRLNTTYYLEA